MNRRQAASVPFSVIPQDEAIRKIGKGAAHIEKRRGEIHFPRPEMCTKESGAHSEHRFLLGCTHTVQHFKQQHHQLVLSLLKGGSAIWEIVF